MNKEMKQQEQRQELIEFFSWYMDTALDFTINDEPYEVVDSYLNSIESNVLENKGMSVELTDDEYRELLDKAGNYDRIEAKMTEFYSEAEDNETDLLDIGEFISSYFGWL
jgi:hypothetical protein